MKENIKHPLLLSVLFFAFSLMFIFMFVTSINYYNASKTTYDDLMYGEFTVESIREITDPEESSKFYIDVVEEEKNIKINNLLTKKKVSDGILTLKRGDKIYCYFISSSSYYEIVELKTDSSTILSLDDYTEIYNRQGTLGIVTAPIMFVIMLGIAVKSLLYIRKEKTTI